MTDSFVHDDAAYVLGALDPGRRAAFEQHLQTCVDCRGRVQEAASVLPALGSVPAEAFDPMPETLLPGLLRRAATSRRRSRFGLVAVGAAAAAVVAAVVTAVWPHGGSEPPAHQMVALMQTPVRAAAALQSEAWGTEIELYCSYVGEVPPVPYQLVVKDRAGHRHTLGTWRLVPDEETQYVSGTALSTSQISQVQIALPDGTPVLQLDV